VVIVSTPLPCPEKDAVMVEPIVPDRETPVMISDPVK
jgi:hypothetical protein